MSAAVLQSLTKADSTTRQLPPQAPSFENERAIKSLETVAQLQCRLVRTVSPMLAAAQQLAELQAVTRALRQGVTFEKQRGEDALSKVLADACPMWQFAERDDTEWDSDLVVLADLLRVANEEASDIARELERCA